MLFKLDSYLNFEGEMKFSFMKAFDENFDTILALRST